MPIFSSLTHTFTFHSPRIKITQKNFLTFEFSEVMLSPRSILFFVSVFLFCLRHKEHETVQKATHFRYFTTFLSLWFYSYFLVCAMFFSSLSFSPQIIFIPHILWTLYKTVSTCTVYVTKKEIVKEKSFIRLKNHIRRLNMRETEYIKFLIAMHILFLKKIHLSIFRSSHWIFINFHRFRLFDAVFSSFHSFNSF